MRRLLILLLTLAFGPAFSTARAADPPSSNAETAPAAPSLDEFLKKPAFGAAAMSPDGRYLAIAHDGDVNSDDVTGVAVTDLKTRVTVPIITLNEGGESTKGMTVDWIEWKGPNRIVMGVTLLRYDRMGDPKTGRVVGARYGRFLMAVNRDGSHSIQLLKGDIWNSDRGAFINLLDVLPNDPDHVLAIAPRTMGFLAVWKVNIQTGETEMVEAGDEHTYGWATDGQANIVARLREDSDTEVIEGRAPGKTEWTTIIRLKPKKLEDLNDFDILGPAEKPGQVYVSVKPKIKADGDFHQLKIYDTTTSTLGPSLWPNLNYDIRSIVYDSHTHKLAGVCYTTDVYTCDFSDPITQANARAIAKYFSNQRSIVPLSVSEGRQWWLLSVEGGDEPEGYYLFNWNAKTIDRFASRFSDVPRQALGSTSAWRYTARDGTPLTAYLTRPRWAPPGPMPLVVLPHGGPEMRDSLRYDRWAQFLATQGYLVAQPNFRGSSGYGVSFAEAGYGQWGGRMADDITDAVRQLIKAGQADPSRICIFGGSYGGYAALFAGATHPELYKCVVSWAGLSDLNVDMGYEKLRYGTESEGYRYWLKSIGDPDKDGAAMKAASPVTYAASYQPPVLLIHGKEDWNVPIEQSQIMEHALQHAGKSVRLSVYQYEGHTDWDPPNEKAALAEVLAFIEAHIAPATPPAAPAAAATKTASAAP